MKLVHAFAKLTSRINVLGICGGLALAGAAMAATPAASAQQFGIGVQFGGPRYVAPAPAYRPYAPAYSGYVVQGYGPAYAAPAPGYWEHRRFEEWRAHDEWVRRHEFYGRPAYRPY